MDPATNVRPSRDYENDNTSILWIWIKVLWKSVYNLTTQSDCIATSITGFSSTLGLDSFSKSQILIHPLPSPVFTCVFHKRLQRKFILCNKSAHYRIWDYSGWDAESLSEWVVAVHLVWNLPDTCELYVVGVIPSSNPIFSQCRPRSPKTTIDLVMQR